MSIAYLPSASETITINIIQGSATTSVQGECKGFAINGIAYVNFKSNSTVVFNGTNIVLRIPYPSFAKITNTDTETAFGFGFISTVTNNASHVCSIGMISDQIGDSTITGYATASSNPNGVIYGNYTINI
jgi:hypothetical protein